MHQTKSSTVFGPLVVPPHLEFLAPPEINYNFISLSISDCYHCLPFTPLCPPPPFSSYFSPLSPFPSSSTVGSFPPPTPTPRLYPQSHLYSTTSSPLPPLHLHSSPFIQPLFYLCSPFLLYFRLSFSFTALHLPVSISSSPGPHLSFHHSTLCGILFLPLRSLLLCALISL